MAVPKQKQSHSRTNKRRSQHKISAPSINRARSAASRAARTGCARTAAPTPGARSCTCTARTTRPRPLARRPMADPVTVAVDANGADLGPAEVARGAALAAPSAACA